MVWIGIILALICGAASITISRLMNIRSYHRAGGITQDVSALRIWERRYAWLTYGCAALIAALNVGVLSAHQPLIHLATVSLIFTFGAGIVSRNAGRPRLCLISQTICVVPVSLAMLTRDACRA